MKKLLYSAVYADSGYPFDELAEECVSIKNPNDMLEPDSMLIVWGGADIDPKLYGHSQSSKTYTGGYRDYVEWALMKKAKELGIPIIGVCRGAQMLCALAGGYLYQHTNNHAGRSHDVETYDGEFFKVNSIHHQMMGIPDSVNHELLAWSKESLSEFYLIQEDIYVVGPKKEPEFVYFPDVKGFAIQWHPEAMDDKSLATQYILKEIYARTECERSPAC